MRVPEKNQGCHIQMVNMAITKPCQTRAACHGSSDLRCLVPEHCWDIDWEADDSSPTLRNLDAMSTRAFTSLQLALMFVDWMASDREEAMGWAVVSSLLVIPITSVPYLVVGMCLSC
jgi:hypothetical protein